MNIHVWTRGGAATVALCLALASSEALAWGSTGHRFIGELAIRDLPASLPDFVRSESSALEVGDVAREPDRSVPPAIRMIAISIPAISSTCRTI